MDDNLEGVEGSLGNIRVDVVKSGLSSAVQIRGWSPVEAAGVDLWLASMKQQRGYVSEETTEEHRRVIFEWLSEVMGGPSDGSGAAATLAQHCAHFLDARIDLGQAVPGDILLAQAVAAWRDRGPGQD